MRYEILSVLFLFLLVFTINVMHQLDTQDAERIDYKTRMVDAETKYANLVITMEATQEAYRKNYETQAQNTINELQHQLWDCERNITLHDTAGNYNVRTQTITVYAREQSVQQAIKTCMHEVGHYEWHEYLSPLEQLQWKQEFTNNPTFPSSYSQTNVKEYYAETIAYRGQQ